MRISGWSSDVCSSDLEDGDLEAFWNHNVATFWSTQLGVRQELGEGPNRSWAAFGVQGLAPYWFELEATGYVGTSRSEEHTSELQSLMRITYAVFCLKKKTYTANALGLYDIATNSMPSTAPNALKNVNAK